MKVSTWMPKHSPLPRTLADVESSREKPVLCWFPDGSIICPMWLSNDTTYRVYRNGATAELSFPPEKYNLYDQPPRPTKLEDVPDRRIVWARFSSGLECLLFREFGIWYGIERGEIFSDSYMRGQDNGETPVDWHLTDCIAELVEVEVEVMT